MAAFSGWRITRAGIIFIIGVIVLGLVAWGVISFIQQRGEQVRRDEATQIAQENLESQTESPVIAVEEDAADDGAASGTIDPETGVVTDGDESSAAATPAVLPETGSELYGLVAVALLAAAGSYFVASRRALARL